MSEATQEQITEAARMRMIADEIAAVMAKHDVIGHVAMSSKSMAHYLWHLEATWSATKFEGAELRIRATKEDGLTQEEVRTRVTDTVTGLSAIHTLIDHAKNSLMGILLTISSKFDILSVMQPMDDESK